MKNCLFSAPDGPSGPGSREIHLVTPPTSAALASASATADEPAGTAMAATDDASADDTAPSLVWPPPDEDLDDWHVIPWRRPEADGAPAANGGTPAMAALAAGTPEATVASAPKKPLPAWLANHRATRGGAGSNDNAGAAGSADSGSTGTAPWLMTPSSSGNAVRAVSPSSLEDTARFVDTTTAIAAMRRTAAPTGTAPTLNLAPAAQPVVPRPVAAFPSERRRAVQPATSPWTTVARRAAVVVLALLAIGQAGYIGARLFLSPAPASASILTVDSNPEGAEVFINGERRGLTPFKVELSAGTHALELRKDGRTRSIPVVLAAGIQASQYVELGSAPAPAPTPAPVAPRPATPFPSEVSAAAAAATTPPPAATPPVPTRGMVVIESSLNLRVLRNGEMLGSSEEGRLPLPAGRHELELMNDAVGYRATVTVQVLPGREVTVPVELPQSLLNISATPSARVWVDGREVGNTPIAQLALPVGQHEVRFEHPEHGERRMTVLVRVGATTQASVDFTR
jgi:hypothetical protein